ncbi:MAG: glycine cleavage system protein GcvH [Alphaproteobacteria bacterium]|nr:glycine cleavage system protein GcvH [Alphaproteobacteria bacterium]
MTTKFTKDHEWVRVDGDVATVGVTPYAAEQLGDVVYVELPEKGRSFAQGADMAVVESAKAASDVYAPISGEVVDVNDALTGAPETVNESADDKGWFVKVKVANAAELDALMDEAAYADYVKGLD